MEEREREREAVRHRADYAIAHAADRAVGTLVETLEGEDAALRHRAAEILRTLASMDVAPQHRRREVSERLREWILAGARPALERRPADPEPVVREAARKALEKVVPGREPSGEPGSDQLDGSSF